MQIVNIITLFLYIRIMYNLFAMRVLFHIVKHHPLSPRCAGNNKVKITDFVYEDYLERTNEWENKLNSFDQKYSVNHTNRTAEADSGLVRERTGKSKKKTMRISLNCMLVLYVYTLRFKHFRPIEMFRFARN